MADENMNEVIDLMNQDNNLKPLVDIIERIMALDTDQLTEDTIDVIGGMLTGAFTDTIKNSGAEGILRNFYTEGLSRAEATQSVKNAHESFDNILSDLKAPALKEQLLRKVFDEFCSMFDMALERYLTNDITLPMKVESDKLIPTYAHPTDAAADLYAKETITLAAHSLSNKINTGVNIALPENWMAIIVPRSSIGAKTGLRLSNSVGIIDSSYRGELGILYDNISDSDYTINAGDRIAQLLVFPSYTFKPQVVDILPASDRQDGGFGSTGK